MENRGDVTETMNLNIETYSGKFDDEIISLILSIQNEEAKIGLALYNELLKYAVSKEVHSIILDTPEVAQASHRFYEKAGFRRIRTAELPVNCFACMKLNSPEEAGEEMKKRAKETEYYFAITLKGSGKVIGEIDAYPESVTHEEGSALDTFSPCWMLNAEFQGKGYAYEAAHAFLDYLFRQKGARRIYAYVEDYNLPSQHLCEKLGMRREGLFQE